MSNGPDCTQDLLLRLHGGDRAALDALLVRHLGWIEAQVRRRVGPLVRGEGETLDFVQEAMLDALNSGPRFVVDTQPGFFREPSLERLDIRAVTHAEVLVRDALRTREQRIRELFGCQERVPIYVLEPLGRVPRGVLQLEHLDVAIGLVPGERGIESVRVRGKLCVERDRILHRQPRAGADREVGRVRRIAKQDDRHAASLDLEPMHPIGACDAGEAQPLR